MTGRCATWLLLYGADMADSEQLLARRAEVLWRSVADGVLVLAADSSKPPVLLLGPAATLWPMLEHPTRLSDAAQVLAARFDASPDVVLRDIAQVAESLLAHGALVVAHEGGDT